MPVIEVRLSTTLARRIGKERRKAISDEWRGLVSEILDEDFDAVACQWCTVYDAQNMEEIEVLVHFSGRRWTTPLDDRATLESKIVPALIEALGNSARRSKILPHQAKVGVWPKPIFWTHYDSVRVGDSEPANTPVAEKACPSCGAVGQFTFQTDESLRLTDAQGTCKACGYYIYRP